jgi:hypothetical protein
MHRVVTINGHPTVWTAPVLKFSQMRHARLALLGTSQSRSVFSFHGGEGVIPLTAIDYWDSKVCPYGPCSSSAARFEIPMNHEHVEALLKRAPKPGHFTVLIP